MAHLPTSDTDNIKFKNQPFPLIGRGMRGVSFVKAKSGIGQKQGGVHEGPDRVLSEAFLASLRETWKEVEVAEAKEVRLDCPKMEHPNAKAHYPTSVRATCEAVRAMTERAAFRDFFPVMVGGDHCLAMGSIAAVAKKHPEVCIIWVDAHADVNTVLTSDTGSMHGMPVAALLGLDGMAHAPGFESHPFRCMTPDRVGYIGLRNVDDGEKTIMKQLGMYDAAYTAAEVKKYGIATVVESVLNKINPTRSRPVHLSFDVDGIDPIFMPSTGTAVSSGLTMEDALYIFRHVKQSGLLVGCDLVEVNPRLATPDHVNVTVHNAQMLLRELLTPGTQDPRAALTADLPQHATPMALDQATLKRTRAHL